MSAAIDEEKQQSKLSRLSKLSDRRDYSPQWHFCGVKVGGTMEGVGEYAKRRRSGRKEVLVAEEGVGNRVG